jgi:hypothetical protein
MDKAVNNVFNDLGNIVFFGMVYDILYIFMLEEFFHDIVYQCTILTAVNFRFTAFFEFQSVFTEIQISAMIEILYL